METTYTVLLRRNRDGATREVSSTHGQDGPDYDPEDQVTFWWLEGNGGCDCNIATEFGDADVPCGDSQYTVVEFRRPDGSVIPAEGWGRK